MPPRYPIKFSATCTAKLAYDKFVCYFFAECPASEFECAINWLGGKVQCVPNAWYCDGNVKDCDNMDDEPEGCVPKTRRNLDSKKSMNLDIIM